MPKTAKLVTNAAGLGNWRAAAKSSEWTNGQTVGFMAGSLETMDHNISHFVTARRSAPEYSMKRRLLYASGQRRDKSDE